MRSVIQRVSRASVRAGDLHAEIGKGFLVLVGLETGDTLAELAWCARKIAGLRCFTDEEGKMNLSLEQVGGEILLISQFTLAGNLERGRRPSFDRAMEPGEARVMFRKFADLVAREGVPVKLGFFQEHMEVELVNDGPVTFVLERRAEG